MDPRENTTIDNFFKSRRAKRAMLAKFQPIAARSLDTSQIRSNLENQNILGEANDNHAKAVDFFDLQCNIQEGIDNYQTIDGLNIANVQPSLTTTKDQIPNHTFTYSVQPKFNPFNAPGRPSKINPDKLAYGISPVQLNLSNNVSSMTKGKIPNHSIAIMGQIKMNPFNAPGIIKPEKLVGINTLPRDPTFMIAGQKRKLPPVLSAAPSSVPKSTANLSVEQAKILEVVRRGTSIFFTGSAGTGKSFLMREIIVLLKGVYSEDEFAITASTGLAACNIGGCTLHSFAGCGLAIGSHDEVCDKVMKNQATVNRWKKVKAIIIDEVSMTDGYLFDKLDYVSRRIRKSDRPFGGIQMIICGDFLQLPPVSKGEPFFAFECAAWRNMGLKMFELRQVFRQSDAGFVKILNEMRYGTVTIESERLLKSLTVAPKDAVQSGLEPTHLFAMRHEVEKHNHTKLNLVPGESKDFLAEDWAANQFDLKKIDETCRAPKLLQLKIGAQVMLIKNITPTLVNGSIGIVVSLSPIQIGVQFYSYGTTEMLPTRLMAREVFSTINAARKETSKRTQFPFILSYAMTIHKSQGQTLPLVKIDVGKVFEKGQVYVAISRATSLDGLQIINFSKSLVKAHDKVIKFHQSLGFA